MDRETDVRPLDGTPTGSAKNESPADFAHKISNLPAYQARCCVSPLSVLIKRKSACFILFAETDPAQICNKPQFDCNKLQSNVIAKIISIINKLKPPISSIKINIIEIFNRYVFGCLNNRLIGT
jgi:hypothetical protein